AARPRGRCPASSSSACGSGRPTVALQLVGCAFTHAPAGLGEISDTKSRLPTAQGVKPAATVRVLSTARMRFRLLRGRVRVACFLRLLLVPALSELLDDLARERRQIVGLAARHEALVDDDLLVHPVAARVADVGLQARPRREAAAADDAGLDEHPGA